MAEPIKIDKELQARILHIQKMDAIGQLAAGIAHDFNNLLLVISSYAELGMEALPPRHPVYQKLTEILNASRRAAVLTRQLLTFGRAQERSPQELDLNATLESLFKLLSHLLGENIECRLLLDRKGSTRIKIDPIQLEQVLLNLANNARDAMPNGGRFTLETANLYLDEPYLERRPAVEPGEYVLLTISDTGHGIPPEHLPRIFEPFFTTKVAGKGTGLGLATVYGIVKQSGGHVWVYSERDKGTTFKIYLPALPVTEERTVSSGTQEKTLRGSETVLFVEDEECVRLPACEFLSRSGYHVLQAADGLEAVRVASTYDGVIHLLVTDVVMPRMSGNDLAAHFWKERPETRVLYISGYSNPTLIHHGIGRHETVFLEKPFTLKEMSTKIRQALSTPSHAPAEVLRVP